MNTDVETLLNALRTEVTNVLADKLRPILTEVQSNRSAYQTMVELLYKLPEFQRIKDENESIKQRLLEKEIELLAVYDKQKKTLIETVPKKENIVMIVTEKSLPSNVKIVNVDLPIVDETETEVVDDEEEVVDEDEEEVVDEDEEVVDEDEEVVDEDEEEVVDEDEEVVEEDEEVVVADNVEENEVFEIDLFEQGKYYTNDNLKGTLYQILDDNEVGDEVGHLQDGVPIFT